jgi:mRNA-degrading endonuclease HigB of HigAB toxin-antitoxin module
MNYERGWAQMKFIGTHAEYDGVDAERVNDY